LAVADAHEDPRFTNSATYAVTVTITVGGGARSRTAHRRAGKVAERLANAAARAGDVVDARAKLGLVIGDEVVWTDSVAFSAANTGQGTYADPDRLFRYLDPDHERALVSRGAANARYRERQAADRARRRQVGCRNADRAGWQTERWGCGCVYCDPDLHWAITQDPPGGWGEPPRCVCGAIGDGCVGHRDVALVVLDDDPESLRRLGEMTSTSAPEDER
jgi:hypothetical protein